MIMIRGKRRFAVAVILLSTTSPPLLGQDQYILSAQDKWENTKETDPTTPQGQLAVARRTLAEGDFERAEHLASIWIEHNKADPLIPDAYLIRADALKSQESYYEALFDYEFVARGFPGSEAFVAALQREFEIARIFARGEKRKLWGMRILDASDEAEELLIRVQERLPGSRLAEQAAMELADFYYSRRQMALAVDMYSIFIENYPDSRWLTKARVRLIGAHLATFKGPEFDISGLREARAKLTELQAIEPATAREIGAEGIINRIDESNASKLLHNAQWYWKVNDPIAAEITIRRLIKKYPRSQSAIKGINLMREILPSLPQSIRDQAPDYEALFKGDKSQMSSKKEESSKTVLANGEEK